MFLPEIFSEDPNPEHVPFPQDLTSEESKKLLEKTGLLDLAACYDLTTGRDLRGFILSAPFRKKIFLNKSLNADESAPRFVQQGLNTNLRIILENNDVQKIKKLNSQKQFLLYRHIAKTRDLKTLHTRLEEAFGDKKIGFDLKLIKRKKNRRHLFLWPAFFRLVTVKPIARLFDLFILCGFIMMDPQLIMISPLYLLFSMFLQIPHYCTQQALYRRPPDEYLNLSFKKFFSYYVKNAFPFFNNPIKNFKKIIKAIRNPKQWFSYQLTKRYESYKNIKNRRFIMLLKKTIISLCSFVIALSCTHDALAGRKRKKKTFTITTSKNNKKKANKQRYQKITKKRLHPLFKHSLPPDTMTIQKCTSLVIC